MRSLLRFPRRLSLVFCLLAVCLAPPTARAADAPAPTVLHSMAADATYVAPPGDLLLSDARARLTFARTVYLAQVLFAFQAAFVNTSTFGGGPLDVTGAVLLLTATAGFQFVSATPPQGACTVEPAQVRCELGAIPAGGTAEVSIEGRGTQPGSSTVTATVSHNDFDPDGANNAASETVTVQAPASITGTKYEDTDGDGTRDAGEAGLNGWIIRLLDEAGTEVARDTTKAVDLNEDGTITADEQGVYRFTGLAANSYQVAEVAQTGYRQTFPGGNGRHGFNLSTGEERTGVDFGNRPPVPQKDPADVLKDLVPTVCPDPANALGYLKGTPLQPGDVVTTAGDDAYRVEVSVKLHMGWINCDKTSLYGHAGQIVLLDAATDSTTADTSQTVTAVEWWPVVNGTDYPTDLSINLSSADLVYGDPVTFTPTETIETVTDSAGVTPRERRECALLVSGRFVPNKPWEEDAMDREVEWGRNNLTKERLGARLDPDDVQTLKNPSPAELLAAIAALSGKCDKLYFYYSGHGSKSGSMWLKEDPVNGSFLSYARLAAALAAVGAAELCIIIDACYSGTAVDAFGNTAGLRDKQVTLITSASADVTAKVEAIHVDGTGQDLWMAFFGYHFWRCYGDPEADADANGEVTLTEAYDWVVARNPVYSLNNKKLVELTNPQTLTKQSITVGKVVQQTRVEVGEAITYRVVVRNPDARYPAKDVTISDALPATVDVTAATATQGTCTAGLTSVSCDLGTIAPGDSVVVTITGQATRAGDATNTARAGLRSGVAEFTIVEPPAFELCGQKFIDLDGDGVQGDQEPGLDGFDFEVLDENGNVVGRTRSAPKDLDGDGHIDDRTERGRFCFEDLPRGTYTIREVGRTHWRQTAPPAPGTATVTLATGSIPRLRFGNVPRGDGDPPGGEQDDDPTRPAGGGDDDPRDVPLPDSVGFDFGDLPDPRRDVACPAGTFCYPTIWWPGPWHVIDRKGPYLGTVIDDDRNGLPDVTAQGDDVFDLVDDEDGLLNWAVQADGAIRFEVFATLEPGENAFLDAWVDLNDDGVLGFLEHVLVGAPLAAGTGVYTLTTVPGTVGTGGRLSYTRLRISTTGSALPTGGAVDGEVEDYLLLGADYGDAPGAVDPDRPLFPGGYPTTLAQDGARHVAVAGVRLGGFLDPDVQVDGSFDAREDDEDHPQDDEDGFKLIAGFAPASSAQVKAFFDVARASVLRLLPLPSVDGKLDAWVDWDRDGSWDDAGEQVFTSEPVRPNMRPEDALTVPVPATAALGYTYARFRFSRLGGLSFDGAAPDGEVEDYLWRVVPAGATGVEDAGGLPERFALYANYPNPFNPTTVIRYDLAAPADVRLAVYDVLGREVAVLVDADQARGTYRVAWDARDRQGTPVASGVYFYRIRAGAFEAAGRMLLVK